VEEEPVAGARISPEGAGRVEEEATSARISPGRAGRVEEPATGGRGKEKELAADSHVEEKGGAAAGER
jgi:hypothetical protein